jgi:hypothetical protein
MARPLPMHYFGIIPDPPVHIPDHEEFLEIPMFPGLKKGKFNFLGIPLYVCATCNTSVSLNTQALFLFSFSRHFVVLRL